MAVRFIRIGSILFSIAVVTIFPHLEIIPIPFGYVVPVVAFIWLYLRWQKKPFGATGFHWKEASFRSVWVGTLAGLLIFAALTYLIFPFLNTWLHFPADAVPLYEQLKGNTGLYIFLLIMGWLVGGLYEEIVFHGFIFNQLEKLFPDRKMAWISFGITNLIFGIYHLQLGYEGALNAFLAGSAYQGIILMHKRNLWFGIIAHAVFDTIALTYLYLGHV